MEKLVIYRKAKKEETACAMVKIWTSRCGNYRIRESSIFGENVTRFYAQHYDGSVWRILSRHREKEPAMETNERHARHVARQQAEARATSQKPRRRKGGG